MKKILLLGSALTLLSTSAFASKSRLQALGEDKDGSYYISDYRNIYINPAELNSLSNMVVMEWGNKGTSFGTATLDSDAKTKAQGGAVYGLSNGMKLGVVLGDETDVAALTRILSSNSATANTSQTGMLQTADNVIDLFVAGQASVNWGANFLYTSSKDENAASGYNQNSYAMRLGVSKDAWNAHTLIALGAKAHNEFGEHADYKGKLGFRFGGGYDLTANNKVFAMYEKYAWDQKSDSFATRRGGFSKGSLGLGHSTKVNDSSTLFAKIYGEVVNVKLDAFGATEKAEIDRLAIPVAFGFEHTATEWLIVRGSVIQNLFGTVKDSGLTNNFGTVNLTTMATGAATAGEAIRYLAAARYGSSTNGNGGKTTLANSTTVNAGMTLRFGKLDLDGNISTTGAGRSQTAATGTGVDSKKGVLALDNLETRVGLTYKF
jgi:hypothetical protein